MASSSVNKRAPGWNYDVFLSFRGTDTRETITNHLYEALRRQGMVVFRDDDELERGKVVAEELIKEIQESRLSIVILSPHYPDSSWCLTELAKIVDCRKTMGQMVLVVFFNVNRSDALDPNGNFEKFFVDHEKCPWVKPKDLQSWRSAMREVGGLSDEWHVTDETQTEKCRQIVKHAFNYLRPDLLSHDENLVGMKPRLREINKLLGIGLNDVRFIGIWGMGGIGKTTIAKAVFKSISRDFHGRCILENVRQASKDVGGMVSLKEKLLSATLMQGKVHIRDGDGAEMMSTSLTDKRIFLVLDDVDHVSQVKELAGGAEWFGLGSRIIVTTRDEGLLVSLGIDRRYSVESLNDDEALQLLCHGAFGANSPEEGYFDLCMQFIEYAEGLPLAIKSLGSSLHGRSIPSCEDAARDLNVSLKMEIRENLRISYDALQMQEMRIFVDIACFLKGRSKEQVIDTFQSFEIDATYGLKILQEKSLITMCHNKIQMHNLHQKLGQEMFCKESSRNRSRLWLRKDVNHALRHDQGLKAIEAIVLDSDENGETHLNAKFFSAMTSLLVLSVHNVFLSGDLEYLSDELRFLSWRGYPLKRLPSHFQPHELLELNLPNSCIKKLWEGTKKLDKLKIINLGNSGFLSKTPDLSGMPNLERLVLHGCVRLHELHRSIGTLKRLTLLDLKDCKCLESIPFNLSFESLKILILSGCSRLKKFPEIVGNMECLTELDLDGTAIRDLHRSIGKLTGLVLLNLRDCKNLLTLPDSIGSLSSLKSLTLGGCSKLDQIPESLVNISCLKKFDVSRTSVSHAPLGLRLLTNLEILDCGGLSRRFCHSLFPFESVARNRNSLSSGLKLMSCFSSFSSLKALSFSDCKLQDGDIPNNLSCLSSLQLMDLSRNLFTSLPDSLCQLTNLKCLLLDDCSRLVSLPKLPLGLHHVFTRGCVSLIEQYYSQEDHRPPTKTTKTSAIVPSNPTSAEKQDSKMDELMLSNVFTAWENGSER